LTLSGSKTPIFESGFSPAKRINRYLKISIIDKLVGLYYLFPIKSVGISICYSGGEMTAKEEELIERLMRENEDFSKAKQTHAQLTRQLEELESKPFLTPQDEMEIKILKKKKLVYKDQMESILMKYR
jgi:uncharacterized protein YdcH (DUF465 family)